MRISDWSSDVCSSDLLPWRPPFVEMAAPSCFLPQGYSAFGGLLPGRGVSCPGLSDTPTVIAGLDPAIHGAACTDPASGEMDPRVKHAGDKKNEEVQTSYRHHLGAAAGRVAGDVHRQVEGRAHQVLGEHRRGPALGADAAGAQHRQTAARTS